MRGLLFWAAVAALSFMTFGTSLSSVHTTLKEHISNYVAAFRGYYDEIRRSLQ